MASPELQSNKMTLDETVDEENEPSDDEAFDITYDDDNKLKKPTQISDASAQETKQPAAVVTTTDRSCLVRPGAHAIQGTMPEQPRPDVSLTNITTAYVVDDDDDNSDKLRLEEENKRLKQELEETHQQPLQLEEIPSAVVLPKRKIWHSRLGIILLIVVIISIGAVIVGVNLSKDNPEEKYTTSEPPSRSLQPTFLPTQSSKPSSSSIPTLSPSKTNAPTSNPTMTAEPTITHSPTDPLTPNPTAFVRSVLTTTISQQFLQTYSGVELMEMNQKQIDYFQSAISTYTQHFAPTDDVYLDVRTECLINEQVVISGSRNQFDSAVLLIIYFTVVYTSNDINVAEASYPDLFRNYMNSDEGKLRTRFNLQSQKVAVDDVDDVTIKEYSSLSPTAVPPEDASNRPTVLDNMPESLSPTTTVTVVVESMSPTTSMTAGRGTDPPTIIFGDRQDDDNFIPLPPPALEDDDPVQDPLNDDFVFRPPPPTPVAVTRSPAVASPTLPFPLPPPGGFSPPFTEPPTTEQRRPTNIPTVVTAPQSVSQRFVQRYEGRPAALLERMTKSQIDYFQNILTDYTPIFASDDDSAERHEFVRTSCIFESQTLIIQERRRRRRRRLGARLFFIRGMQVETPPPISFLNVEFTMTYNTTASSNRINVTEYPIQFRNYMNFEEGNMRTLFNLQSVGMPIERIDNVLSLH